MSHIPVGDKPVLFVDVETTGLSDLAHEVIEVAIVTDSAGPLQSPYLCVDGDIAYFTSCIKPARIEQAEPRALQVNGYTAEAWADAPSFGEVLPILRTLFEGALLCGHNVGFDIRFLQQAFLREGDSFRFSRQHLDTMTLAYEHLVPQGLASLSMDAIRKFLGWPIDGGHRALQDAMDARRLFTLLARPRRES